MSIESVCKLGLTVVVVAVIAASPVLDVRNPYAHAQQGIGERLGQQLDVGINRLSSELREGWASLRQSVDRMGVQARVYSRLRWDKQIATTDFEIDSADSGVVTLRGQVRNAAAKAKAVELARDTVGVERVVDELTINDPSKTLEPAGSNPRTND